MKPMKEKRQFGPAMEGLEDAMEIYLHLAISRVSTKERFNYLEIGVEHGRTFSAMVSILADSDRMWSANGVDIPGGPTLIPQSVQTKIEDLGVTFELKEPHDLAVIPDRPVATLYLKDSPKFLAENWNAPIHFCLIDGNHTKEGVMADFLGVEPWVPPGGIVAFHDFSERSVGEMQPECGPVNVTAACKELGLVNICNRRPCWRYAAMVMGNSDGRELGVFERV